MTEIGLLSTLEQTELVRSGELSSRELTEHFIERIERLDPEINAVVTRDFEVALKEADDADEQRQKGKSVGALHGIPITVKDALETRNLRSTGGAIELRDNVPDRDAAVVASLRKEGAIVMGKTNLPRWSGDIQSYNEIFGTTNNPWDLSRGPGGSSGGAAAAVAMGFTSFEIGTDIGGSIRFPAAFNGIWGHKPSFGVIPTTGYLDHPKGGLNEADINVFGPLARSSTDLDFLLDIMQRNSPPWIPQLQDPPADPEKLRVGAWLDDPFCPVDQEVRAHLEKVVNELESHGISIDRSARPQIDPEEAAMLGLWLVQRAISQSTDSDGPGHRIWLDRHVRREEIRLKWAKFFDDYDAIIMPVSFVPPFEHQQDGDFANRTLVCNGQTRNYVDLVKWTTMVGMAYLPSTVPPTGIGPSGLPIGCQVVGAYGSDKLTISLAGRIGELMGDYQPPPRAQ
ncbi:MAG TPA: amidase [Acidimicrobiaceae bacterium]|jgi:amidase|nr:amidase [Acidimicrobiaceae bacterium]|tara:strand:- start:3527 stop:4891 length:1365 start_codon:yes stop_codon:yes gene_type:complete